MQKLRFPKADPFQRKARKRLEKECNALVREIVFRRDNRTCRRCGRQPKKLDPHHFHGRRYRAVQWEPLNIMTLCSGCHFWVHANPAEQTEWFKREVGQEVFDMLMLKKRNRFKMSVVNLRMLKLFLEQEVEAING